MDESLNLNIYNPSTTPGGAHCLLNLSPSTNQIKLLLEFWRILFYPSPVWLRIRKHHRITHGILCQEWKFPKKRAKLSKHRGVTLLHLKHMVFIFEVHQHERSDERLLGKFPPKNWMTLRSYELASVFIRRRPVMYSDAGCRCRE